jgi:hypothetical protein
MRSDLAQELPIPAGRSAAQSLARIVLPALRREGRVRCEPVPKGVSDAVANVDRNRGLRGACAGAALLAVLTAAAPGARAQSAGRKFGRGLAGVTLGVLEVPDTSWRRARARACWPTSRSAR